MTLLPLCPIIGGALLPVKGPRMRKLPYRTTKWKVSIPTRIAGLVERRLTNLQGTGPAYGARSQLVAYLLEQWLAEGEAEAAAIAQRAVELDREAVELQHQGAS